MGSDRSHDYRDVAAREGGASSPAAGASSAYSLCKAIRFQVKANCYCPVCSMSYLTLCGHQAARSANSCNAHITVDSEGVGIPGAQRSVQFLTI